MELREMLVEYGKRLLAEGLTSGTSGNLSLRCVKTGRIYLTPSGMDYGVCAPEDMVVCDINGDIVSGERRPTIERSLHLAIYRARPDVNAVAHTHPLWSTALSTAGQTPPLITDAAALTLKRPVPLCPWAPPGSLELAENCASALARGSMACLLERHGAVCVGSSMEAALLAARVLEQTSEIYWRALLLCGSVDPLPEAALAALRALDYGQPDGGEEKC